MPVDAQTHRIHTGLMNSIHMSVLRRMYCRHACGRVGHFGIATAIVYILLLYGLLALCGDIELNPGPTTGDPPSPKRQRLDV